MKEASVGQDIQFCQLMRLSSVSLQICVLALIFFWQQRFKADELREEDGMLAC